MTKFSRSSAAPAPGARPVAAPPEPAARCIGPPILWCAPISGKSNRFLELCLHYRNVSLDLLQGSAASSTTTHKPKSQGLQALTFGGPLQPDFLLEAIAASFPTQLMVEMTQLSKFTFGGPLHPLLTSG
jgi:hypothetical protein